MLGLVRCVLRNGEVPLLAPHGFRAEEDEKQRFLGVLRNKSVFLVSTTPEETATLIFARVPGSA